MRRNRSVTKAAAMLLVLGITAVSLSFSAFAKKGDEILQQKAEAIAKATKTTPVKTIWWKAKTTKKVKVTTIETTAQPSETVKLKKGQKVTVVQRDYHIKHGVSECQLADGRRCWIANKYLKFTKAAATGAQGDYDVETKEAFVNGMKIKGYTGDKLIWISLDKQRVNVFQDVEGKWVLIRECKCSSGSVDSPTFDQTFKSNFKIQKKEKSVSYGKSTGLKWYSFIYGYGMHQWKGSGKSKIGKVPLSHSCVRLKAKDAKWIYKKENCPVGTRVYVW